MEFEYHVKILFTSFFLSNVADWVNCMSAWKKNSGKINKDLAKKASIRII